VAQDDMGAKKVEVLRYRKRVIYSLHIAGSTSNPCFFFFLFSFELKPNFDGRRHENKFFKLGGQLQKCEVQKTYQKKKKKNVKFKKGFTNTVYFWGRGGV
jgi:hypothetical protein